MAAPMKRPTPPARMRQLLKGEKRHLLAANGDLTRKDFDAAWEKCWDIMLREHAWAHATKHRRASRRAMVATRREYRAAFLDEPTPFAFAAGRLESAADGMCLRLDPDQLGKALLAAIAYVELDPDDLDLSVRAADNAYTFLTEEIAA